MNGSGGGYVGAVGHVTATGERALPGESPPDTNGHGTGGTNVASGRNGGGGGSHGKLLFLMCLFVTVLANILNFSLTCY